MIKIVNMGTGRTLELTLGAVETAKTADTVVLQTSKVEAAQYLEELNISFYTLDELYDNAQDFSQLTQSVCDFFTDKQDAAFFILGSSLNNALAAAVAKRFDSSYIAGVSFSETAFAAAKINSPFARSFAADDIDEARITAALPIAVTEIDSEFRASDVVLKFERFYPYDSPVYFVKGGEAKQMPLYDVLKETEFSYDTSLVFPGLPLTARAGYTFDDLVEVIKVLRSENGCPWDRQQTYESLRQYLIEESLEAIDAVNHGDPIKLFDELGDVLLQVVIYSQIGSEHADFDDTDVTTSECEKMIHRHTHVFGTDDIKDAESVLKNWDKIKRRDAGETVSASMRSVMDISALMKAAKVQKKASFVGFDWEDASGALAKLKEEIDEFEQSIKLGTNTEEEAGDLLFSAVNVLRLLKISPDVALYSAVEKFIRRYEYMEEAAKRDGVELSSLTLAEQDVYWDEAKKAEKR